ncbi:MAG TPA: cupin domain-containing protein [Vicinamibacterales bacterium]|nr:cupin domain-containing protein [Vicinamibacterales bacterium]
MRINIGTLVGLIGVSVATMAAADRQAGAPPAGITRTELENNATALIARLRMAPGAREDVHTHPFSAVVVQIGAGDVDMRLGDGQTTTRRAHGFVEFIPKEVPHAAANVGQEPFEVVTIAMKPDRRPGGEAPALPAPAGITRTPVLDNAETRVTHVTFASRAREPVHTHPFDLVVVQLTPGRVEVRVGKDVSTREYAAGEVIFLPRDVPHAVSNVDREPFELLSVGIK